MVSRALRTGLSVLRRLRGRLFAERGQGVLEYMILTGILAVAAGLAATLVSGYIHDGAHHVGNSVNTPVTGTP
jgi:hypothetical protein